MSTAAAARIQNHGRQIFLYNNLQTNQVVYSLTRVLNNRDALAQIPIVGKKSKPPTLRKDMWTPLASVSFPNNAIGLKTYHKLREFRKLHETSYDERIKMETSMKVRKYIIMNQRANSIADLAESLRIEIERAQDQDVVIEEGDVIVRWRNVLDAEYAGQWPELVQHAEMGRGSLEGKDDRVHVAPKAEIVNKPVPQAPEVEKKVRAKKPKVAV